MTRPLLAAYPLAPADPAAERAFYEGVAGLDISGLETPLPPDDGRLADPAWLLQNVAAAHDLLLTCVPTVVHRRTLDRAYGLASTDDAGRRRALLDVRRACDLAAALADRSGRPRVLGIELQSAPGPDGGSADALLRSLAEVQTWERAGARLVLEHCDALVPGQEPQKGFLSLAAEIEAVRALGGGADADAPGIGINWGRSAIEGRSAATPVEHLRDAAASGLLATFVLSGAAGTDGPWGPAWTDAHLPPRGDDPALADAGSSLLGVGEIRESLVAAGIGTGATARATPGARATLLGVKVAPPPRPGDVASRLALAEATLAVVASAAADLGGA